MAVVVAAAEEEVVLVDLPVPIIFQTYYPSQQ